MKKPALSVVIVAVAVGLAVHAYGWPAQSPAPPPAPAVPAEITVPAGFIGGLPVGISFVGRAWSEPTLIKLAYAYEQATKHRRAPTFAPTAASPVTQ